MLYISTRSIFQPVILFPFIQICIYFIFSSSCKCMFLKADQYLCIHAWPCIQQPLSIHTGCSCFSHSTKQTINAGQYLITLHFLKSLKHPLPFLFSQYKSCESETQFGIQFGTFPLLTCDQLAMGGLNLISYLFNLWSCSYFLWGEQKGENILTHWLVYLCFERLLII